MNFTIVEKVREQNPLIHNITNIVVSNDTANGLLAIGASPFMANAPEESGEVAAFADALVLNIGTITSTQLDSMLVAGTSANAAETPVIFDPVGAGATNFRRMAVKCLLENVKMSLIRGNIGELAAIAGVAWNAKGVDAGTSDGESASPSDIAKKVATQYNCIVAISGEEDVITDGITTYTVKNGTPYFTKMTGGGCLLTSVCGAYLAVDMAHPLEAVFTAMLMYSLCGEMAASELPVDLVGSFRTKLLDKLSIITSLEVRAYGKYEMK